MKERWAMWLSLAVLCLLLARLQSGARGFGILLGRSLSHMEITERAILNATVHVCHALAQAEGTAFTPPAEPFTAERVAAACGVPRSSKSFSRAITLIKLMNMRVDLRHPFNASQHFDDESFVQGRRIITEGILAVKAGIQQGNYEAARKKLGELLHPTQDFYSHSNWVELGNEHPNANLIRSDSSVGNIAAKSRATCRNCDGDDCRNNILDDIIAEGVLTSGYFSVAPVGATKPQGKCSHGGGIDRTSTIEPKGGINKDTFDASHGHLHTAAANMATAATSELLQDIRKAAGDNAFLQAMGISRRSSKALCFLIDTTESMKDDIAAVNSAAAAVIDSEVGTESEPSVYMLVAFNDPDVGPIIKSTDPKVFKSILSSLSTSGGGDKEEPSLSALQLGLANAPFSSEFFLFTDAPAKDKELKNTVTGLIERTQSVVNFVISGSTVANRRRLRNGEQQQHSRIEEAESQLYRDLAQTSGGQAVEVTTSEVSEAISVLTESTSASLVTLLQAARNPGQTDTFSFLVDQTVENPVVYMTGRSITYVLTSPTGESQQSSDMSGSLIFRFKSVGNLIKLQLVKQTGEWRLKMMSTHPYTLKVVAESRLDFLFDFVEESQGLFQGLDVLDTRPTPGANVSLLVSVTGSDNATVTEVSLAESMGSGEIKGVVEPQESTSFLVKVAKIPSVEFVVRVKGRDNGSPSSPIIFQRQSSTSFRSSNLTISADSNSILSAGTVFSLPFSLKTGGPGGNFTVRVTNSQGFDSTSPSSLYLESGKAVNGTVTVSTPRTTPSGTEVTLAIEAEAPGAQDTNYVVLRFTVINTITDFTLPVCQQTSLLSNCSANCSSSTACPAHCSSSTWNLTVRVSDGAEGSGVALVSLKQGNGTMSTTLDGANSNVTLVSYRASCCQPDMELRVADRAGNVGSCFYSLRGKPPAALAASAQVRLSPLLFILGLVLSQVELHTAP